MKWSYIIIHHSLTADGAVHSNVNAIRKWHVNINKWRDIGYNWILDRMAGRVETVMGRLPDEIGAHSGPHFNRIGIGICCVGNYDLEAPPEDVLHELERLVLYLMHQNEIPVENVIGHGEAQALEGVPQANRKSCPGKFFNMAAFRERLSHKVAA